MSASSRPTVLVGVHVHERPDGLLATLESLRADAEGGRFELVLLPDGPDAATRSALAALGRRRQDGTAEALGPPACFNRLALASDAEVIVLLESGSVAGPGWLDALLAALAADPPTDWRARRRTARGTSRRCSAAAAGRRPRSPRPRPRRPRASAPRRARWRRSTGPPTSASRSGGRCSTRSARPTRASRSGPAGRWSTPPARCARASARVGLRGVRVPGAVHAAPPARGGGALRRPPSAATRTPSARCGCAARAPATSRTAAARSASTSPRAS